MMVDPIDLVGVSEIATALGVRTSAVSNWQLRAVGFPDPVVELRGGRLWLWQDVEKWAVATGRRAERARAHVRIEPKKGDA